MDLPPLSSRSENVFAAAALEGTALDQAFLGVEHLFLGLVHESEQSFVESFGKVGGDLSEFLDALRSRLRGAGEGVEGAPSQTPRLHLVMKLARRIASSAGSVRLEPAHLLDAIFEEGRSMPLRLLRARGIDVHALHNSLEVAPDVREAGPAELIEQFGRDLTAIALKKQLSPVIGRAEEIDLLAQALLRKNKNNPVLVGAAGVGKTAVVEGFAQRIASGDCPEPFRGNRIIELSVGTLVAGTKYRGQFEERLQGILKELVEHPEIIVFLDEIHTLVGAGSAGGESLDASNMVKPALARGDIRCIGATTVEEYRRYIERDAALERRFEKIFVEEPSSAETLEILQHVRSGFEGHHEVEVSADALRAAVDLTAKHVPDRRFPDKALDALDQACAGRRLARFTEPDPSPDVKLGTADIARVVARWTGIPLERLGVEIAHDALGLEEALLRRVHGQDHAVAAVARTILTAKAGLADDNRPLGTFFFLGPTGVGKTHLAKCLAEALFDDPARLVRIDMSEYMEPHTVSNLIGAPPGYVGYEREGVLISALRTHPHCVVLFDEVEKAHPQVFDLFLQILDEGRLTGSHGKSADFRQATVILTSNFVPAATRSEKKLGFELPGGGSASGGGSGRGGESIEGAPAAAERTEDPRVALQRFLRPEFVNRLDEVITFRLLDLAALRRIVETNLDQIRRQLAERKITLSVDDEVHDLILEEGYRSEFGAREIRRCVDRLVRQPLARAILKVGEAVSEVRISRSGAGLEFGTVRGEKLGA